MNTSLEKPLRKTPLRKPLFFAVFSRFIAVLTKPRYNEDRGLKGFRAGIGREIIISELCNTHEPAQAA
jgi:hypothetical protein